MGSDGKLVYQRDTKGDDCYSREPRTDRPRCAEIWLRLLRTGATRSPPVVKSAKTRYDPLTGSSSGTDQEPSSREASVPGVLAGTTRHVDRVVEDGRGGEEALDAHLLHAVTRSLEPNESLRSRRDDLPRRTLHTHAQARTRRPHCTMSSRAGA